MQDTCWTFTAWPETFPITLPELQHGATYYIVNLEKCPSTGRMHLQGYIQFDTKKRMETVKKIWGNTTRCAVSEGSDEQNYAYCSKTDSRVDGPWERGVRRSEPGRHEKRKGGATDSLKYVIEWCREHSVAEAYNIPEFSVVLLQYGRRLKEMELEWRRLKYMGTVRTVEVTVLIGPPGCGKTPVAAEMCGGWGLLYRLPSCKDNVPWFDGYNGEKALVIDDIEPNQFNWNWLLQILEGYPLQVQVKGTMAVCCWDKVLITSNYPIEQWFDWKTHNKDALTKRIKCIRYMGTCTLPQGGNTRPPGVPKV